MMARRSQNIILSLILLGTLSWPAWSSSSQVGTSGASFLRIGAGARPTGMGDAFVGIADDVNAAYSNPAGLTQSKQTQLTVMHTQWFQDANYDFAGFVLPSKFGSFAITAATLEVDDFQKRALDESYQGTFKTNDAAYGLSYARDIRGQFSLGGTLRYVTQEIDSVNASALSLDLGIYKRFKSPLSLGLALRHMGPEIEFRREADPQPFVIDVGAGYRLLNDRLLMGLNVMAPRDNDPQFGLGSEYVQPVAKDFKFAFRLGYNSLGTDADGASGLSVGGGVQFRKLDLDFAWVPMGDLGNTMRYSASMRF